jgi:glycosyltransferase involved in cell wall biosynthesis
MARVCHMVASTDGARWMAEQLAGLRDRHGLDVTAIIPPTRGPLVDLLAAARVRMVTASFACEDARAVLRSAFELARLLRRERFDVVQTHVFHTMMVGRIAAWLADVPVRAAMIAGPYHLGAAFPRAFDAGTAFMEDVVVASCALTRRLYRGLGVPDERLALVYYGADQRRFEPDAVTPADVRAAYGWAADAPVIGSVAWFYPVIERGPWSPPELWGRGLKGHEELLRAARVVLAERPDARFLLVGDGWGDAGRAHRREMMALAAELGLGDRVAFAGQRDDIPAVLAALDVSVQASLNDNLGGTLESLFMARPLVATRQGGFVDAVRDGATGVLVAPGDPEDLARGILALLRDPARARTLGQAGRRLMLDRFTLDRTVDDLAALYQRLLAERPPGYRLATSAARALALGPVGAYLAARFTQVRAAA